jgi:chemotaxis protein MotB
MAKRKKEEEKENHERWMVSYADFVTLLFAFFTCLYAISSVDTAKMGQMVASMKVSFGGQIFDGGSNTLSLDKNGIGSSVAIVSPLLPEDASPNSKIRSKSKVVLSSEADMGRFKRTIEGLLSEEIKNNQVRVYLERRGVVISLGENGNFDSGSDALRPDGMATLDTIATSLATIGNYIRVEGHADNVPINTMRFPSNWHLSTARATTVISRMVNNFGMSPELMSPSGYGEYHPVASNDTVEGRARNRRVDIVVLNPAYANLEPL